MPKNKAGSPVEVFTFDPNIVHTIPSLPLPLSASGFLLARTHGDAYQVSKPGTLFVKVGSW